MQNPGHSLPVIGWREWVALPELDVRSVKAKVDTGARTSSLHAFDLEYFKKGKREMVRFEIHPEQRGRKRAVVVERPVLDVRSVTSSGGHTQRRPVILTPVELMGERWEIEVTLTSRDVMGFRMLLGRQAIRGRFLVDPGRSYANGRRVKGTNRIKRRLDAKR